MALYRQIILERSKSKQFCGRPAAFDVTESLSNPLCGDEVTLFVSLGKNNAAVDIRFEAYGCAICLCSADLLADLGAQTGVADLAPLAERFIAAAEKGSPFVEAGMRFADDFTALLKIRDFPSRIGCATLPWQVLQRCLQKRRDNSQP